MASDERDFAPRAAESTHTLAGVLSRVQRGERGAPDLEQRLNEAFSKHADKLRNFCRRELRGFPLEVVEETTQEVLFEAWNKLPTYRAEGRFRSFLWAIAAFKCANVRRKRRNVLSEDDLLQPPERSALTRLTDLERNGIFEEAARNVLNAQEQEVTHLRWVLDYPYEDIAALLGFPEKDDVRTVLVRCKRRMEKEVPRLLAEKGLGDSFLRPSFEADVRPPSR